MSGENRRPYGWFLPVIVVAVGAYFLISASRSGTLAPTTLKGVNWVGLGLMGVGLVAALMKKPLLRLRAASMTCGRPPARSSR